MFLELMVILESKKKTKFKKHIATIVNSCLSYVILECVHKKKVTNGAVTENNREIKRG